MTFLQNRWKSFSALIPAAAMAFLDQTILPVALPTIQAEFQASDTALQWSIDAYLLTIAVFVLVGGKLGDRIGYRKSLMMGICGFTICSVICGMSTSITMLIVARALQGVSAALIFPSQTALVAQIFPLKHRGKATGMIVSISSLFMILGPLVGGYLTQIASWHWIFWINLPIGIIGLWLIGSFLPASEPGKGKIDLPGFFFFAIGSSALTISFMEAGNWGWISSKIIVACIITVIAGLLLLRREHHTPHPFLDLTLFKRPIYSAITINVTIIQFIIMITVSRIIYLQEILGYSPLQTGMIAFASSSPMFFFAPIAGFLSDRYTPKLPIAIGYLCLIYSFIWLGFFSTPSLFSLLLSLTAFGAGIPLIFTPSYSSALASVPLQKSGVAMGVIVTLRMLGGTIGLALIQLFISSVERSEAPKIGERLAKISAFSNVHFALGFLLMVAFAVTFVLHNRKSAHHLPETPAEGWD